MKNAWSVSLGVFACALTMGLAAQTPPAGGSQQPPAPGAQRPAASSADKVTVTGCLEKASASAAPTGTSGAASSAAGAKFMLKNAEASKSAPGTAGTSGAAAPIASSYSLDGEDSKLAPHVGHKIEVTGSVADRPKSDKASPAAAAATPMAPKLKVEAVKMIASSCTP